MLKFSVRYTFIQIRILEQLRRFKEIPNILLRMTNVENNIPFLQPLPFEKASFYFLVDEASIMHKKFCFFQYLAAMNYFNQTIDLKKYSLNCFYMISSFFQSKDQSYLKIKEHLYSTMADIALKNNKFENSSYFYANSIVLSLYKQNNEEQQDRFLKRFLKSVKEDEKKISPSEDSSVVGIDEGVTFSSKFLIKELRFPQIINSSLISFEEQDVNLLKYKGWNYFNKFNSFDVNYVNISDSDMIVLKNLDFLADNKLFKNEKKKFKSTVNSKIYIKIMIKNPLAIALTINSIKLITQYSDNFNCNENVELEELSVKLKPYSSNFISLSVTPLKCGNIKIVGLEVSILGIASFKSFFMDIDNRDENNLYKEVIQNKEKYPLIEYNIIDADNDIAINFLNSQINLFQYQFGTVSVRITNKSKQMVIKKFSIFFDSSDVFISNYLHFFQKEGVLFQKG